ncbi:STAS domain-containing protein [Virgibacillus halophilus]|uniref:STAS domain-containing protein n=2 Tax=Tigheibacillus halophilus TaxID=361280 RepID=A0ABU5CC13_9BACI|nr:STAS domain-containing protein [Virgibacillus halophilus]
MHGKIDDMIDLFINGFFLSYSTCKDELIEKQRKMVDNLSAPIIPITDTIFILPLIGTLDDQRARIIEEKVLMEIGKSKVRTLIMDLSGIAETAPESIDYFSRLMEAVKMMGCEPIISGLRPKIVQQMIRMDIHYFKGATRATLQQALYDSMFTEKEHDKKRLDG